VHLEEVAARTLSQHAAALTSQHIAFGYLNGMQSPGGLCQDAIDRQGNFNAQADRREEAARGPARRESALARAKPVEEATPNQFLPLWEQEWVEIEYDPAFLRLWLLCSGIIITIVTLAAVLAAPGSQPEDCSAGSLFVRGTMNRALAYLPLFCIAGMLILMRSSIKGTTSERLMSMYPACVIIWVVALNGTMLSLGLMREASRDLAQGQLHESASPDSLCSKASHVSVYTNFSSFPPTRTCVDRDPVLTISEWPFPQSVGCGTLLVDATFPRYAEHLCVSDINTCVHVEMPVLCRDTPPQLHSNEVSDSECV